MLADLLDAPSAGSRCQFPDVLLELPHCLRRNSPLRLSAGRKAEPEELSPPRSVYGALAPIHLELEFLRDEACDTLHHPLPRPFAADVDVTIVRITHEPVATLLQLTVQVVKHQV